MYTQMRVNPSAGEYRFSKATFDSVMFKYDIFTGSFKGVSQPGAVKRTD